MLPKFLRSIFFVSKCTFLHFNCFYVYEPIFTVSSNQVESHCETTMYEFLRRHKLSLFYVNFFMSPSLTFCTLTFCTDIFKMTSFTQCHSSGFLLGIKFLVAYTAIISTENCSKMEKISKSVTF